MKPLLTLVDLQQDYLASSDLQPTVGSLVLQSAALLACCRHRGIPVAHILMTVSRDPDNRMKHWKALDVWRCEQGTPGHLTPPELTPLDGEAIFHKTGFNVPASAKLMDLTKQQGIDTVIIAGVKTHACVRQLALDVWQAGLAVWIASDATGSDDPLHAAVTRRYLQTRGVDFLSVAELTERLDGHPAQFDSNHAASIDVAVVAARSSFYASRATATPDRAKCVQRLHEVLTAQIGNLAMLMAEEIGKPVRFGYAEVQHSLGMLLSTLQRGGPADSTEAREGFALRRRPHGAVAAITPWNNPIYIPLGKIVPAFLCGNAVVWKPAIEARMVSRRLFQCLTEAGWPEGLVNLVEGGQCEAESLMNNEIITAVTITGSSATGFVAQEICARRRIPLQAELGGNNAAIIWHDADLHEAARMVAAGAFEMAGQRCTANRRVIVHESRINAFTELLLGESAALKWGDPLDASTDIGPLVSTEHRYRVAAAVDRAVTECGGRFLPFGDVAPAVAAHAGKFYPPTVHWRADPQLEIVQEETFGPVLVMQVTQDWQRAMQLCNGVRQGLAASIFTTSADMVAKFLDEAEVGILKVNQSTAGAAIDAPFGGWKASGVGIPEHGRFDIEFYTRQQTVYGAC
jgi:acyl-CoA reductase-like NAD-dependent aldehyde dehydrogenase/nicotinamidase-related amidase